MIALERGLYPFQMTIQRNIYLVLSASSSQEINKYHFAAILIPGRRYDNILAQLIINFNGVFKGHFKSFFKVKIRADTFNCKI